MATALLLTTFKRLKKELKLVCSVLLFEYLFLSRIIEKMMEPTNQPEVASKVCEVCGDPKSYSLDYGLPTCGSCQDFLKECFSSKDKHVTCSGNQECVITISTREKCPCCRLKKCLFLGADPCHSLRNIMSASSTLPSVPFFPCSTCSPIDDEMKKHCSITSPDDKEPSSVSSTQAEEDSSSSSSTSEACKICGEETNSIRYGVTACLFCGLTLLNYVKRRWKHEPCSNDQLCIITENCRQCPCCRLKKCLSVGMDYESLDPIQHPIYNKKRIIPSEWFALQSCDTCDLEKIQDVNKSIEDFKILYMELEVNSEPASSETSEESETYYLEECELSPSSYKYGNRDSD